MKTTLSYLKPTFLLTTLCAVFLSGTALLQAGTTGVQDNGGFFSDAAKADATRNIKELQKTEHIDLAVETFATIPDNVKSGVNLEDKAAVDKMAVKWAHDRFQALAVNGVYVLLVKQPGHLQIQVGNDTEKQGAFTKADRESLNSTMLAKLKAKDNDAALREGVAFVLKTVKSHDPKRTTTAATNAPSSGGWASGASHTSTPTTTSSSSSSSGFGWVGLIIVLVVLFIGIRIIAAIFHAIFGGGNRGGVPMGGGGMPMGGGYGGNYGGGYGGGGGGGFMRSMFGGILGAAAGSWMYDSFFGHHGSSAYGSTPNYDNNQGGGGFNVNDTDSSGSGGSFGGDDSGSSSSGGSFDSGSSGGDFGGGGGSSDWGGGGGGGSDFGGGGGGGDSGSSGGDF